MRSFLRPGVVPDPGPAQPPYIPRILWQTCGDKSSIPPDLAAWATARLCPQPVLPQQTPLWPRASEALPRHYIVCDNDQTIPPAYQRQMAARLPETCRHSLPSGHSPFLSMPDRLADLLARLRQTLLS